MSKTWTGTRCTLLTYKQPGNIFIKKTVWKIQKNRKIPHANEKKSYCAIHDPAFGNIEGLDAAQIYSKWTFSQLLHHLPLQTLFWLPHLPEATKCPFVGTNFNETILPCLFQFGRPVLFLKIQKIIKMLKLGRSRPLKVYNRNHQKNPRNKKRTIKKSLQNIIKMKNS